MYPDNNWYSHRKVLADYCGVQNNNILGSIQHGWVSPFDFESFIIKRNFNFFCWNDSLSNFCNKRGFKKVIPIGAPFLYLCKQLEKKSPKYESKGTLVFPSHSNLEDYQKVNHFDLIDIVEERYEKPFSVHFYYTDYHEENIKIYKQRGWKVLSSKIRSSNDFLINLYYELNKVNNVVSTDISTILFYAMYLLKKVSLVYKDKKNNNINFILRNNLDTYTDNFVNSYQEILSGNLTIEKQKEIADFELGKKFILKPFELNKLLGFENLYKRKLAKILSKVIDIKQGRILKKGDL